MSLKNRIRLWYDSEAQQEAEFYAAIFPHRRVTAAHHR